MTNAKSETPPIDTHAKPRRLRFSMFSLLWLQLLIAPAFLSPVYYRINDPNHPYVLLLAFLIAPICYVTVFSTIRALRVRKKQSDDKRSVVFAAVRRGAFFGVLFSAMALGPLAILAFFDSRDWLFFTWAEILREWLLVACFAAIHYVIIGAATGGVVGLLVDARRKKNRTNATEPADARESPS